MEQPMLSIASKDGAAKKTTPHLLPCRVHHDGTVGPTQTYWSPREQDGKKVAYFRGRKLHGTSVNLPNGYRGIVAERKNPPKADSPKADVPEVIDVDAEDEPVLGTLETKAEFDEVIVWGHEATADAAGDPYVRSIDEWLQVTDQIHSYEAKD